VSINKDESIVTQVAAKIASELTDKNLPVGERLAEYSTLFDGVQDLLFSKHGFTATMQAIAQAFPNSTAVPADAGQGYAGDAYSQPFGDADRTIQGGQQTTYAQAGQVQQQYAPQPVANATMGIRIKGDQFGPIPNWLFEDAAKVGVTEVYDNRGSLGENPRRPWFKSTSGGQDAPAFWPPKN
jgi:hypothetical protein